mgnify:CR=1 FL=1
MGFFLETLLGGLMAGVLYSLVALGFVLIFKASGVFNFAQGAMVLFAALSMARFSEWLPLWLGFENKVLANLLAFAISAAIMLAFAWPVCCVFLETLKGGPGQKYAFLSQLLDHRHCLFLLVGLRKMARNSGPSDHRGSPEHVPTYTLWGRCFVGFVTDQ